MTLPVAVTLTSSAGGTVPFTVGHAFRQGDVPSGSGVVVGGATAQATVMNLWSDGSVKFAILAGTAALSAGVPGALSVSAGTASTGTALTTTDLKATGITASIACGAFGTVSWATTDWDSPLLTFVSGHRMSSWIYRKAVGADAHLVGWLEVRLYAGGAVEVLPWVENGYILTASPTSKSATYVFTMGTQRSSQAIDLPSRCRTPLVAGAVVSYWLGTDPGLTVQHSASYLMSTSMVPTYRATTSSGATVITSQVSSYTPLQQGNWSFPSDDMTGTGYSAPIGLLPEHDVLYLVCATSAKPWVSMQLNTYGAGRYAIHYRDENTFRPLAFSDWPRLSTNSSGISQYPAAGSGTSGKGWDIPHHPSQGYAAYLMAARFYFLEQCQFVATRNYLSQTDALRGNADGVFQTTSGANTVRGAAWAIRSLAQAAAITPTSHALAAEFIASLEANVDWYHARYIAQAHNAQGFVQPYLDDSGSADNGTQERSWMQDFFTAATGYAKALDPDISSGARTKLTAFFSWKAQNIIGRLGADGGTEWPFVDAAVYNIAISPSDSSSVPALDWPTGTGPWYASWRAVYNATNTYNSYSPAAVGNALRGGNFPESVSYWGNVQPAIAYAVQHGVSGAQAAYDRMVGASNWSTLTDDMNVTPVWSVAPGPVAIAVRTATYNIASAATAYIGRSEPPSELPAWFTALPLWSWEEIPGSSLSNLSYGAIPKPTGVSSDPSPRIETWCGATLVRELGQYWIYAAGGHADWCGNEATSLSYRTESPGWTMRRPPAANAYLYDNTAVNADLSRSSTHTYYATVNFPLQGKLALMPSPGSDHPSVPLPPGDWPYGNNELMTYDMDTDSWDAPTARALYTGGGDFTGCLVASHPITGDVFYARASSTGGKGWKYKPTPDTWTELTYSIYSDNYAGAAVDIVREEVLIVGSYSGTGAARVFDWETGEQLAVTFTGLGGDALKKGNYPGVGYDEALDKYMVFYNEDNIVKTRMVDPTTWAVSEPTIDNEIDARPNGLQNAAQYDPVLKAWILANRWNQNVKILRTA